MEGNSKVCGQEGVGTELFIFVNRPHMLENIQEYVDTCERDTVIT